MNVRAERVTEFHRLHSSGCFVMPNPWDVGSALALEQMGLRALATTSAGFAWTLGRADKGIGLEETLVHLKAIVDEVSLPVNADFEGGYAVDPEQVGANVKRAAATGIAGLFITVAEAAALGVRRISVGGTLARVAWFSFRQAAQEIADTGTFTHFNDLPNPDVLFEQS